MQQELRVENRIDEKGNPAGGTVTGIGLDIRWQDGPLGRGEERNEPNGCFVETVIAASISRLDHYQESRFACQENAAALSCLRRALAILNERTAERERRAVEGTHNE